MKRYALTWLIILLSTAQAFAVNGQKIITATGDTVIEASPDDFAMIQAVAVIATSTTAVSFSLYNEDNDLLGSVAVPLVVDLDGGDGPSGFVLPFNEQGWFQTDAANEAVKIRISGGSNVIVVVTYKYIEFHE